MAYQNIDFPILKLLHGYVVNQIRPVTVVSNFAKEYRISRYANNKRSWVYPPRNVTSETKTALLAFFDSVGGYRDSFNFSPTAATPTVKARFDSDLKFTAVAFDTNNTPTVWELGEIRLVEVFNE